MILIVGLGNPGRKYAKTRHNLGFMVVDELAKKYGLKFRKEKEYLIAKGSIKNRDVIIIKPLTYMNFSGVVVNKLMNNEIFNALPNSLIVVHDDIDLPLEKIKIKINGSSGGHRGVQSIIDSIGTKNFIRVKIGIGKDPSQDPSDYVLSPFTKTEKAIIKGKISDAVNSIAVMIDKGVEKAMNLYN